MVSFIDYRQLNDCTQSARRSIPNIESLFHRLGTYHSDNLSWILPQGTSRPLSVFLPGYFKPISTLRDLFILLFTNRPKGPSYLQQIMSSVFLLGLILSSIK
jgi:hypothetical protein